MLLALPLRTIPGDSVQAGQSKSRNGMKSGQGRLILRDRTDPPTGYRLMEGVWSLVQRHPRRVSSIRASRALQPRIESGFGGRIYIDLLVTGQSKRHVNFVANTRTRESESLFVCG